MMIPTCFSFSCEFFCVSTTVCPMELRSANKSAPLPTTPCSLTIVTGEIVHVCWERVSEFGATFTAILQQRCIQKKVVDQSTWGWRYLKVRLTPFYRCRTLLTAREDRSCLKTYIRELHVSIGKSSSSSSSSPTSATSICIDWVGCTAACLVCSFNVAVCLWSPCARTSITQTDAKEGRRPQKAAARHCFFVKEGFLGNVSFQLSQDDVCSCMIDVQSLKLQRTEFDLAFFVVFPFACAAVL